MENHFNDEDFNIPTWSCPESSPTSPDVNLEFFPFGGLLCSFEGSLQPYTDMEAHPPKEEDQRGEKHNIEDEVFVHLFKKNAKRRALSTKRKMDSDLKRYALCSMRYAMFLSTNSVMSIALMGISFLRAVVKMVRTHC